MIDARIAKVLTNLLSDQMSTAMDAFGAKAVSEIVYALAKMGQRRHARLALLGVTQSAGWLVRNSEVTDVAKTSWGLAKLDCASAKLYMEEVDAAASWIRERGNWNDVEMIGAAFEKIYWPWGGGGTEFWRVVNTNEVWRARIQKERDARGGRFGRI